MAEEVKHYQVNGKYRVVFERSAVKGQDGFKVDANSDSIDEAENDAKILYDYARGITAPIGVNVKEGTNA